MEEVKDREFIGYSYDGADASFELLARRVMGDIPRYISIKEYDGSVKKNKTGNIIVSDQAGKSNIISRLKSIGVDFKKDDPKIKKLLDEVKDREFIGYSYDGADASFELLARRIMGEIPRYISINEYDVSVKKNSEGKIIFQKNLLQI